MGIIEELEKLGEAEVLRGMANGLHGQSGSQVRSQVEAWLRLKEYERSQAQSELAAKGATENLNVITEKPLVFISYDTRDLELVYHLDLLLKRVFQEKISTFIAQRDIKAGQAAFQRMLQDSLAKCKIVLALCTKRSLTSPWLWFESGAGFGRGDLIPMLWNVTPEQINPPMNIFQGKNLEDKVHVEQMMTRVAEICGIECDTAVTDEEYSKLKEICTKLDGISLRSESTRIEDMVELPLPGLDGVQPVQYIIEASFPLQQPSPRQRLLDHFQTSTINVPGNESRFGFSYPDVTVTPMSDATTFSINCESVRHFSNELHEVALVVSDSVLLSHWVRNYRDAPNEPVLIDANEISHEAAMAFTFFNKLATQLMVISFNMRIRLYGLQGGHLKCGKFFERSLSSFRAPATNDVEASRQISSQTPDHDFSELLMQVWERFQLPNGQFPKFKDLEYVAYLRTLSSSPRE